MPFTRQQRLKQPSPCDRTAQMLMGFGEKQAGKDRDRFEKIRDEICDFCLTHFPSDGRLYFRREKHVENLVWRVLEDFRQKHDDEIQAIQLNLQEMYRLNDANRAQVFLVGWVAACNRSRRVANRTRLHPERNLLECSAEEILREIHDGNSSITAPAGVLQSTRSRSAFLSLSSDRSQASQSSLSLSQPRSSSHSPAILNTERKRGIGQVRMPDDSEDDGEAPRKTIRHSNPVRRSVSHGPVTESGFNGPPDWSTVILRFKAMNLKADDVRVPIKKFLYDPKQPAADLNPYNLKLEDLGKHMQNTVMGRSMGFESTYARLAGDTEAPALLNDGELGIILMKWESLTSAHSRFEEIVVEIWTRIEAYRNNNSR